MVVEIMKRIMLGFAFAAIFTFIVLTILMLNQIDPPIKQIWLNMLASMTIGAYFGLASFIFDKTNWTPLVKTTVHFSLSIVVYFIIAINLKWIPLAIGPIIFSILTFVLIYVIYWCGYYFYYKRIEETMNAHLGK